MSNATVDTANGKVTLTLPIGDDGAHAYLATMSPNEARHIATMLQEHARHAETWTKLTAEQHASASMEKPVEYRDQWA